MDDSSLQSLQVSPDCISIFLSGKACEWSFLKSRWYWDVIVVILLIFTVIVLPVSIAFYSEDQTQPVWLTINSIVDILFITDIVINFRTGIASSDNPDIVRCSTYFQIAFFFYSWLITGCISSLDCSKALSSGVVYCGFHLFCPI